MRTGLLWFDDDPRKDLVEKVLRAAAHYERKYGQAPDLCFVHPSALGTATASAVRKRRARWRFARDARFCHITFG